jgi:amidase
VSDDYAQLDATGQAELVRSGEVSPAELVDAAIARAEALNPELNAIIHELYDEAREAASGELPDGPFRGVPFVLKDLGAGLAGQPLHMGLRPLKDADFRFPVDTYLGARFRDAGFVTIGKTNTPQLGILPTTEPKLYGPTRNPWNTGHSTGGSSGGSGAAVASGMVPVGHANDGGGSIRIPASECGLVGLKPTRQRISEGPLIGDNMSGLTCELVVSHTMRDTAAILDAVHGPAPGDPYVAPPPLRPYVEELEADPQGLRVALITESFTGDDVDPIVVEAAEKAASELEALGHSIDKPDLSIFGEQDVTPTFMARWAAGQAQILATLGTAIDHEFVEDDVEPLTWALAEIGKSTGASEYLQAVAQHQVLSRMLAGLYETYDLLLTPTLGEPPPPLGTFDDSGPDPLTAIMRASLTATFTAVFNVTGQPAISLPLYETGDGLPVGVQLAAPFGREDLLIAIGSQLERAVPWADRRPQVFAAATA